MSVAEIEATELGFEAAGGGLWRDAWQRLRRNPGAIVGFVLVSGFVVIAVFAWPGIGSWLRDAIFNRDYPVIQGGILFVALIFVLVNLIVDISYAIINPRIRVS